MNYYEIIEVLLQNQESSKYLLKPVIPNDTNKLLRTKKAGLINTIILKGSNDWEGLELSEYSRNLQKMIEGKKTESVYALDVEWSLFSLVGCCDYVYKLIYNLIVGINTKEEEEMFKYYI